MKDRILIDANSHIDSQTERLVLNERSGRGDDRSVKIKSLEAAKIMKIERLVLGCIEADFCK